MLKPSEATFKFDDRGLMLLAIVGGATHDGGILWARANDGGTHGRPNGPKPSTHATYDAQHVQRQHVSLTLGFSIIDALR